MQRLRHLVRNPAVAVGWTLLILAACSIPGMELPKINIIAADKLVHIFLFAVLAFLWMSCLRLPYRTRVLAVLLGGIAYALGTEWYQGWIGLGRIPDPFDAVANTAGVFLGIALFAWSEASTSSNTG